MADRGIPVVAVADCYIAGKLRRAGEKFEVHWERDAVLSCKAVSPIDDATAVAPPEEVDGTPAAPKRGRPRKAPAP